MMTHMTRQLPTDFTLRVKTQPAMGEYRNGKVVSPDTSTEIIVEIIGPPSVEETYRDCKFNVSVIKGLPGGADERNVIIGGGIGRLLRSTLQAMWVLDAHARP
jgi:hypothetical protein